MSTVSVDTLVLYGRQNIVLRGHCDSSTDEFARRHPRRHQVANILADNE